MTNDHVGAVIRALRLRKSIKQTELADAVGMRPQAIYRLETGVTRAPKAETLVKIADVLGVPVQRLVRAGKRRPVKRLVGAA